MEASKQCPFRKQEHDCNHKIFNQLKNTFEFPVLHFCDVCLQGQQNDELGLLSGAIMALIESKELL